MNRLAILLLVCCAFHVFSEPAQLKLAPERLVIFKDGYGLVVEKGQATANAAGQIDTTDVPDAAVLGSFWATTEDDKKILAMRAEWDEHKDLRKLENACQTIPELLRANVGKTVTLELTDKTEKGVSLTQEGKIAEILDLPASSMLPSTAHVADRFATTQSDGASISPTPYTTLINPDGVVTFGAFPPDAIAAGGTLIRELAPRGGDLAVLENNGTRTVLPVSHIQSVSGKEVTTRIGRQEETYSKTKRLTFDFGKAAAGKAVSLRLYYFTPGLRWIPTYRVNGELKDKADLALQGEVLNDVIDVEHADLDLVVGVPNFRFKDSPSPLTLEHVLRNVLLNTENGRAMSNSNMVQSQFANNDFRAGGRAGGVAGGEEIAMAPDLAGATGEQDLFVYSAKDFSLKKGARATLPLWTANAPLRHLYTYDLKPRRGRSGNGQPINPDTAGASPMHIQMNEVWHQLELTNSGKVPWTTGAALMMRDLLPLGQDLLTYTPPGGRAMLPVTIAVDLRGASDERETERKPNALRVEGDQYAQIKKEGTITLINYRKEKSDMRITLSTGGQVTAASNDGKIKLDDYRPTDWEEPGYTRPNNHTEVTWEVTLEAGETKTLTYNLQFYIR